jgi:hypothetical protein
LLWDSLGAWSLLVSPVIVVVMFLIGQLLAEIIQPLRGFEHCPKCGGWRKHGCNGICQR